MDLDRLEAPEPQETLVLQDLRDSQEQRDLQEDQEVLDLSDQPEDPELLELLVSKVDLDPSVHLEHLELSFQQL